MTENSKNFKIIQIKVTKFNANESESTLNDDSFADLKFEKFLGFGLKKISNRAFGKSSFTIKTFSCFECNIQNSLPNYSIWKSLSRFPKMDKLSIGLNVTEIPTNAIRPIDGSNSQLREILFHQGLSTKNITIKSMAFYNLNQLTEIEFNTMNFRTFEKDAFKFSKRSYNRLKIIFSQSNLDGVSFNNGSFDGIQRPVKIEFRLRHLNYLPESSFKSLLIIGKNRIVFGDNNVGKTYINCEDCRNHWLIRDNKEYQVINAFCKEYPNRKLFDQEIVNKIKTKCEQKIPTFMTIARRTTIAFN